MEFYLAPMEGITGYVYRQAHERFFHTVDKYFSPFLAPNQNRCMNSREKNDVLPEHNIDMKMVPQILTNQAAHFLKTCEELRELGYNEVNLNLGCPSGTVVTKKKGAGFLGEPALLKQFLDEIFSKARVEISIKTRIGMDSPDEFPQLMKLFNQYPLKELIIHPRIQKDFYKNTPRWEVFQEALTMSRTNVCYNGDIFTMADYEKLIQTFPTLDRIMLGRGVLVNPNLIGRIMDGRIMEKQILRQFHDQLFQDYRKELSGDRNLLFKMKELWFYLCHSFANPEKYYKKIKKAEKLSIYEQAVDALFCEQELKEP